VAEHCVTGHQVALKFINKNKIKSGDNSARVKREIQYLKVLRHPHIIKLYVGTLSSSVANDRYEVLTTPADVVMVMEYAGEELFTYIVETGKGGVGLSLTVQRVTLIIRCPKRTHEDSFNR
jgi:carbon catabolite-derepressing protein kinase